MEHVNGTVTRGMVDVDDEACVVSEGEAGAMEGWREVFARLGAIERQVAETNAEVRTTRATTEALNRHLIGTGDTENVGLLVRVDRLEQELARRGGRERWLWTVVAGVVVMLAGYYLPACERVLHPHAHDKPTAAAGPRP